MKKQFVTYPIALALKELGFNEPCFAWYNQRVLAKFGYWHQEKNIWRNTECNTNYITAPLWQQVISWFATKYNIHIYILHTMETTEGFRFLYVVEEWGDDDIVCDYTDYFKTYEEAREAAILEAIKIVKGEKNG